MLAFALCLLATGCGTASDARISLKPPSTSSFGAHSSAAPTAITLVRPEDMRTQTRTLGGLHQVFQQDVFSDKDPVKWVGDSLALALRQAGYAVRPADTLRTATTATVVAPAVTETGTRCLAQVNGWRCTTIVAANIEVYKNTERIGFASYKGQYSDTFFTLALPTSSQYESTFSPCPLGRTTLMTSPRAGARVPMGMK